MNEVEITTGGDRINVENEMHDIYKEIIERSGASTESAPFFTMKDVFMWATALGYAHGQKRPLAPGRQQPFRWSQLSQDLDIPTLKTIAVADTEDVEILIHADQILRIAEEYANAGIRILKQDYIDQPGRLLWNLVDLVGRRTNIEYGAD
jgi:dnd system-associated protein 4